ncbi:MAG: hypothetical protein ACYTEQ_17965 [Planctomycetota bacterium]|jgi:hypothetical protein
MRSQSPVQAEPWYMIGFLCGGTIAVWLRLALTTIKRMARSLKGGVTTMSEDLLIRMEIPVDPPMEFRGWLPLREDEFVSLDEDNIAIKFWFDLSCSNVDDQNELSRFHAVRAHKIFVDVTISGLSKPLLEHIRHRDYSRTPTPDDLRLHREYQEYRELGERVYTLVLGLLNRLVAYLRAMPGQFWLQEYPVDLNVMSSDYTKFRAQATTDGSNWFPWRASQTVTIAIERSDSSRFITESSWSRAKESAISLKRPPLVWQLLAGADSLASSGHTRSALTEAVTALEVAASQFARNSYADKAFGPRLAARMDAPSLNKQIEHTGLTATIRYLFPVIFSEEQIPTDLLRDCQEAIECRGNVVHRGQRVVKQGDLQRFLASIRKLCVILEELEGNAQD